MVWVFFFKQRTAYERRIRGWSSDVCASDLGDKVEAALRRLGDLKRTELLPRDNRIYPGTYAGVMVSEDGKRILRPMRYQCRPEGKPAAYDRKYPGTYNARRDNLDRKSTRLNSSH